MPPDPSNGAIAAPGVEWTRTLMGSPSLAEFRNERGNPGSATMDERRYPPIGLGVAGHRRAEAAHGLRVCLLAAMLASLSAAPVSAQDGIGLDHVVGRAAAYVAAYVDVGPR